MKTGIPCAHILTGKTCLHCREPVFKLGGSLHATQRAKFAEKVHKPLVVLKMKSDFHTENEKVAWDLS